MLQFGTHTDITVTMGIYVEIMREVQQDAVNRMDALFKQEEEPDKEGDR